MSYAISAALQAALYERLSATIAVPVHDAAPDATTGTWVLIGPEEVRDRSDGSGTGAEHRLVISVLSDAEGFLQAKTIAAGISDALVAPLGLGRGRVVSQAFERASAKRLDAGRVRRIDLTFKVRVEDIQQEL